MLLVDGHLRRLPCQRVRPRRASSMPGSRSSGTASRGYRSADYGCLDADEKVAARRRRIRRAADAYIDDYHYGAL